MRYDKRCENCGRFHDGSYGSSRFCSKKCASSYSAKYVSKEGRKKQKETLTNKTNMEKALTARMENSNNYEKDSEGRWQKVTQSSYKKKTTKDNALITANSIGKLKTAQSFINHGYKVFTPIGDDNDNEMIVKKDDRIDEVQIRTSMSIDEESQTIKYDRLYSNKKDKSKKKKHNKDRKKYLALINGMTQDVYLIEDNNDRSSMTFRTNKDTISDTVTGKNLERLHMAEDFLIDKVLDDNDNNNDENVVFVDNFSVIDDE